MSNIFARPLNLESNTFKHFYLGGANRAYFAGETQPRDDYRSEEWFFSTNPANTPGKENHPHDGISKIKIGGNLVPLTDLLKEFPELFLGTKHFQKYGPLLGILVKIFDCASFIPVHWHPNPIFAQEHLNSKFGKTEAWIILSTREGAKVWIGWNEDISREQITSWFNAQSGFNMREKMHMFIPKSGDIYYIPAGMPHSLYGCCVLEPQEPTDWSIIAEWKDLGLPDANSGLLGLDFNTTLDSLSMQKTEQSVINAVIKPEPRTLCEEKRNKEVNILPLGCEEYFRASKITLSGQPVEVAKDTFYCLYVANGFGELEGENILDPITLIRGTRLFFPYCCAGKNYKITAKHDLEIYCFQPNIHMH